MFWPFTLLIFSLSDPVINKVTGTDLYMFTLTNAQERTLLDWEQLLRDTDPRLKLTRVSRPEKSFLAIMEVT
ncbi:S-adenosyl-L-methionine-dependent methyltransferase [Penicillium sp. IBT 16267x]|nr:S-adenosyl-L-methionine-dependent methyltransferase [Penicillium sp. IBT 16267x]